MHNVDEFVAQIALLLVEAERQRKTIGSVTTRLTWFYAERMGVDYVKLLDAVMWTYQNYRGDTE